MKTKISILTAVLALMVMSCKEEIRKDDNIDFREVEFAAPLVKLTIPLLGSLNKHVELEGGRWFVENGIIWLEDTLKEKKFGMANEKINVNDKTDKFTLDFPDWTNHLKPPSGTTSYYTYSNEIKHPVHLIPANKPKPGGNEDEEIEDDDSYVTEAYLNSGIFKLYFDNVSIFSQFNEITITVTSDELTNSKGDFIRVFTKTNIVEEEIDFTKDPSYKINTKGKKELTFTIKYDVKIDNSSKPDDINLNYAFTDLEFSFLAGYFGQSKFHETGSVNFDFFDKLGFEYLRIKNFKMELKITNPSGVPIGIGKNYISGSKTVISFVDTLPNSNNPDIEFEINKLPVDRATRDKNNVITSVTTKHNLEENVSFGDGKYKVKYDIYGITNPDGDDSAVKDFNFVKKDGDEKNEKALLQIIAKIPFELDSKYIREDTIGFDYRNMLGDDETMSKSIKDFKLYFDDVDNRLPLKIGLKICAIKYDEEDEKNHGKEKRIYIGDGIKDDLVINVQQGKQGRKTIEITDTKLAEFWANDVNKLILETYAITDNTSGQNGGYSTVQKIKEDAKLDMDIKVEFKSKVPISF